MAEGLILARVDLQTALVLLIVDRFSSDVYCRWAIQLIPLYKSSTHNESHELFKATCQILLMKNRKSFRNHTKFSIKSYVEI